MRLSLGGEITLFVVVVLRRKEKDENENKEEERERRIRDLPTPKNLKDFVGQYRITLQLTVDGGRVHYVIVSKVQWKPFWLATQLYPQNDWTGWQNGVNDDECAQAPSR